MSKISSRKWEKRFLIVAGVVLAISVSVFTLVALSIGPVYTIRINGEPWTVTGTKAVQEIDCTYYAAVSVQRSILYPGQSYDKFLEINITVIHGSLDFRVESLGETLIDLTDVTEMVTTLTIEDNSVRIFESPHESNFTIQGYIKAYCWIPASSAPIYYIRALFGSG